MSWMMAGGAALSIGGSLLGSKGAKGPSMTYAPSAYQSMSGQQKANYDTLSNNNTAYINNNMQRINSGRAPEYAENMVNQLAPYLQKQNKQQFMGRPGDRGGSVMGLGAQNSAMMGLNPKARMAQMGKTFQDYQQAQSGIDMQMANMKYNAANQMAMALPGWSQAQQGGIADANRVGPGQMMPGTQGKYAGLGQAMGGIGGMMFGQGLGGIGGGSPTLSGTGGGGGSPMSNGYGINNSMWLG